MTGQPPETFDLIATASFGLEAVVVRELEELGLPARSLGEGVILFHGNLLALARANLWLRSADRVLLRLGQFPAHTFDELFEGTRSLPWTRWLTRDSRFPVTGKSIRSTLTSIPACQSIIKKAVVEKLKSKYRVRTFPESGPPSKILFSLDREQATLSIDTSGDGLFKRGYKRLSGAAPLKETLAAALVLLSVWDPDRPFWDPFCGTGTIAIEAAQIGLVRAPGLSRQFAAETWQASSHAWLEAREEARSRQLPISRTLNIHASDIDPGAVATAEAHAREAGFAGKLRFQVQDVARLRTHLTHGCLITNPPYGERVGEPAELDELYMALARSLQRMPTWSAFVLTAYPHVEAIWGRPADRRRKLFNARIPCTYYQYRGPRPPWSRDLT